MLLARYDTLVWKDATARIIPWLASRLARSRDGSPTPSSPNLYTVFRKRAFDRWYYTPGGVASGVASVLNKQVLVTGARTGLRIRG